ncbi:MAG: sulfatase [bacterium]|nr:sulfatase [bacterium]
MKTPARAPAALTVCLLLLTGAPALLGAAQDAQQKPNVLLIAIDDLNDWVGCLGGHPNARTPSIDRLAGQGVLFTNAHCQAPICNPSRTSVMLGLRPSTTGVYMNRPTPWRVANLKERVTMPRHFAAAGYKTLTTGKIYHGSGLPPGDFEVVGPRSGQRIDLDERLQTNLPRGVAGLWDFGPQRYEEEKFIDHVGASWAIEQLRAEHDRPFFLAVGFYRPHVPFYSPERVFHQLARDEIALPVVKDDDREDLPDIAKRITESTAPPPHSWFVESGKWREAVQSYLACARWTDEQVGRLLDTLDASDHAGNTVVVLYSDHGFHLGEKQRWAKFSLWERSTRVPFVVMAPGKAAGERCARPVELLSIYPTLIELCGVERREDLEGVSLVPLLENPDAAWERPAITTHGKNNHAIRDERYRYVRYSDGSEELYDHREDPREWTNLASDPGRAKVIQKLAGWIPKTNAAPAKAEPGKSQ